jgi:transposase-like protein
MVPKPTNIHRIYSLKDKLSILLEWETGALSCKAVARKYHVHPCQMRGWKKNREGILEKAASIKDITSKHHFFLKMSMHEGRKPATEMAELERVKAVYDDLRERERVVTLYLLAHDLRRHNVSLKDLSVRSVRRRVYQHLVKQGVVRRRVTRLAQNTRYDQNVKNAYVSYVNENIKIGLYLPEDIVSMDETNLDFDQEAGETLANRGDITIGQAVIGIANRCTVLLAVTMSGKKLPPYIIFKGKDTRYKRHQSVERVFNN